MKNIGIANFCAWTAVAVLTACGSDASTNSIGPIPQDTSSYGIPWNSKVPFGLMTDARDGQTYRTVNIGTQVWMARNLNFRKSVGSTDTLGSCYNNSTDSCAKYGRLYTWAEAMDTSLAYNSKSLVAASRIQGACPNGWHVASSGEWDTLVAFAGGSALGGRGLKADTGWPSPYNGTDSLGFRGLSAGCEASGYKWAGQYALFWTRTQSTSDNVNMAMRRYFGDYSDARVTDDFKTSSFSVRCLAN
jgi:uncharacterized protein (TIGR02145 family)